VAERADEADPGGQRGHDGRHLLITVVRHDADGVGWS